MAANLTPLVAQYEAAWRIAEASGSLPRIIALRFTINGPDVDGRENVSPSFLASIINCVAGVPRE